MANKGNLTKNQVNEVLENVDTKALDKVFIGKNNKPCSLASRTRIIEGLKLTGKDIESINNYQPKVKAKPKIKPLPTIGKPITKIQLEKLSADEIVERVKALNGQLSLYKGELNRRTK